MSRRRPKHLRASVALEAGLIIDAHTTQIEPPKMPYEDAKVYFDGKNSIYGYKNEIAVSTSAPHICLFASPNFPGSVHDYEIHRQVYRSYGEYLQMTPDELNLTGHPNGVH